MTALTDLTEEEKNFLIALVEQTIEKSASQASMYDIGALLEMEREVSLRTAESLMSNSLVEVKTLSGGIGLTDEGMKAAKKMGAGSASAGIVLGDGTVMEKEQCEAVDAVCAEIKVALGKMGLAYELLSSIIADVKTMEMQLMSLKPKTVVFRTCLASINEAVAAVSTANEVDDKIVQLLGE